MNEPASLMRSLGIVGFILIVLNVIFPRSPGLPGLVETAAFWLGIALLLIQVPFWLRRMVRRRLARVSPPETDAGGAPASPPERLPR
jgi:hypothetical protein